MAAAGRRGRRDNGLDAVDWRAIDDLDPRVSEEVLDALGTRGIAAYVQPAMDVDPVTRSATVPSRPADRLYVDRQRVEAARECVRELLGGPRERDDATGSGAASGSGSTGSDPGSGGPASRGVGAAGSSGSGSGDGAAGSSGGGAGGSGAGIDLDATFAGIVADFGRAPDPTAASWPAAENLPGGTSSSEPAEEPDRADGPDPPGAATTTAAPALPGPADGRHVTEPSLLDALDTFGADLPDELPERFVPPPPPPLPRLSRQTVLGWLAIAVGLVLVLGRPDVLALDGNTTVLLGFALVLGGAVALILRLRPGTDPEDRTHPDDGAQV